MSNLIPVQRVDKNGRLVTRHVRPGEAAKAPGAGIPSPKLSDGRSERLRAARDLLADRDGLTKQALERRDQALESLSDEELDLAYNIVWSARGEQGRVLRKMMFRQIILSSGGLYSEKLRTADLMIQKSTMSPNILMSFLNTLKDTEYFNDEVFDLTACDETVQRNVCMIADAVAKLGSRRETVLIDEATFDFVDPYENNGIRFTFRKPELFEAMAGHPERAMEILEWYRKRKNSTDGLEEMLQSVPALSDGAL